MGTDKKRTKHFPLLADLTSIHGLARTILGLHMPAGMVYFFLQKPIWSACILPQGHAVHVLIQPEGRLLA